MKIGNRFVFVQTGRITIKSLDTVLKKLSSYADQEKTFFQIISLSNVISERQIWHAVGQTIRAIEDQSMISKKPEFELLIRLSGKRQIQEALRLVGLHEGKQEVALVGMGEEKKALEKAQKLGQEIGFEPENQILDNCSPEKKIKLLRAYAIPASFFRTTLGTEEKKVLEELIIEKMALVSLES